MTAVICHAPWLTAPKTLRVVALALLAFLAMEPLKAFAQQEQSFRHWGVCIESQGGSYTFTSQVPVDFMLVDITRGDTNVARLYIGRYPNVENSEMVEARAQRRSSMNRAFVPLVRRSRQHLSFPPTTDQNFIHLMLGDIPPSEQQILLRSIRYCETGNQ